MIAPITDPAVLEGYLTDASNVRGHADALFRPKTVDELAAILAEAQATATPVTLTAARTSTTAAPVPFGGWLVSMEAFTRVLRISHDYASAEAGILLGAFQREIEATGRFFPPDPTSRHDCTLGGAIACNASGARTFRYGPTRPWVEALTVVLPTGKVLDVKRGDPIPEDWPVPRWTEPAVKTAAGYAPPRDLLDVFVGQEGTLGVLVEATVRLTDLPAGVMGLLAYFRTRQDAVAFVERARRAVRENGHGALSPRCLEYLDRACLTLARERVGNVPEEAQAALFCEQELEPAIGEEAHLAAWWEALVESGALADATVVATDPKGQAELHALRHAVPAGINEKVVRNGMPKVATDLSVPDAALTTMMDAYEQAPVESCLFGHIGDNHLHLNLLPRTPDELAAAKAYYGHLAEMAVALGGSVSGEHGIGKVKKAALALMVGPETLSAFRALKKHVDPAFVLGRGTMFD